MKKRRLDEVLIAKGQARDRQDAFIVVTEGRVTIDGQKAVTPAQIVGEDTAVAVREHMPYVGRGAYKLSAALDAFAISVVGKICADIGAATGGFTQVLLERGAAKVYAIDTARGKIALKIRQDPRVIVMEETDVRDLVYVWKPSRVIRRGRAVGRYSRARTLAAGYGVSRHTLSSLPEPVDLVVIDVSLISLRGILSAARRLQAAQGSVVALFKPQYETRDPALLRHGVIRDDGARNILLHDFSAWLGKNGWRIAGEITSPIRGGKGNTEYLFHLISCYG